MRTRRRQVYVITAIISTVVFFMYGKGSSSGLHNSLRWDPDRVVASKNNGYHDEGSLLDWYPSVFQQWREHQPLKPLQSSPEDCLQLTSLRVQRACSQRLQHVNDYCAKRRAEEAENGAFSDLSEEGGRDGTTVNDSVVDVFSYQQEERMVMYCSVHKVASTFWISLFRFLHNDTTGGPVSSPELLSKYQVHIAPFRHSRPLALAYVTRHIRPGDEQFRFMFTRNPYHRLWAVYIDKFVLPDFFFWSHHTRVIQDMILHDSFPGKARTPPKSCFDISFENFVLYAVQDELSSFAHSDDHILPVSRICNPCAFHPHFIGHMENVTEESEAVLARLNLTHLVQRRDFQGRALRHMQIITEFVHDTVVTRRGLRHCVSDDELQARLFRAFVLNGYLPPESAELRRTSVTTSLTQLWTMIRELFLESDRSQQEVEAQRKKFMINAYHSLPWDLMYRVRSYYSEDFDMFGYDPEPPELFTQREEREQRLGLWQDQ